MTVLRRCHPSNSCARALGALAAVALALAGPAAVDAGAMASHAGWPPRTGMLLMNKLDQSRPLDLRPGHDPFDGADPSYSCDGLHPSSRCFRRRGWHGPAGAAHARTPVVPANVGHNELLGGNGSDTIYAGPAGDVIWGDYKPSGQPDTQVDHLFGGPGNDYIYASHGTNFIYTGGGVDVVHATFGRGEIHCDSPTVTVVMKGLKRPPYTLFGCQHVIR